MTPPTDRCDMSDHRERDESAQPAEANDPTEKSEHALPIDPIESTGPTDPIESTEPFEAIERNELSERIDQRDAAMAGVLAHPAACCAAGPAARTCPQSATAATKTRTTRPSLTVKLVTGFS